MSTRTIENYRESQLSGDLHFGQLIHELVARHEEEGLASAHRFQAAFEARVGQYPSIESHVQAAEVMAAFDAFGLPPR